MDALMLNQISFVHDKNQKIIGGKLVELFVNLQTIYKCQRGTQMIFGIGSLYDCTTPYKFKGVPLKLCFGGNTSFILYFYKKNPEVTKKLLAKVAFK